jgi:hypothetical protein
MPTLEDAVKTVLRLATLPFDGQTFYGALREVTEAAANVDEAARNQALTQLNPVIEQNIIVYAALTALTCGAVVEQGADANITAAATFRRTAEALKEARYYASACEAAEIDPFEQTSMQRFGPEIPLAVDAWNMLEYLYRPAIALMSRSKPARPAARQTPDFLEAAKALEGVHHGADWLYKMLMVLDDEELIVLHPGQKRGFHIKISGIADNFQFHLLLADRLIGNTDEGWLEGSKPPAEVVAKVVDAANTDEHTASGVFNLVNYTGLLPSGEFDSAHSHWIWGEGIPADILPMNGTRIILLDKPPYSRSWNAQRMFEGLRPELHVLRKLSEVEFNTWMQRIKDANAARQTPPNND